MSRLERAFDPGGERYKYDCGECSPRRGFAQVDTKQDAPYYGTWANPTRFIIVTYCEGDVTREYCDSAEDFKAAMLRLIQWAQENNYWKGIDPGWPGMKDTEAIETAFKAVGLGEYIH